MANWVKYGAGVFVSGGLVITGVLLWDAGRQNSFIRGEDLAELMAANVERETLWTLESDSSPPWPSNNISGHLLWSQIYNGVMCGARTLATNVADGVELSSDLIAWRSGAITNGMDIAGATCG